MPNTVRVTAGSIEAIEPSHMNDKNTTIVYDHAWNTAQCTAIKAQIYINKITA